MQAATHCTFDNQASLYRSQAHPVLVGNDGGLTYSRGALRWLPAAEHAVSPDGLRYAYAEGWVGGKPERLHLVDATTGMETVSPLPQTPFAVIGFETDAIYLTFGWEALKGLWRFDVATGNVTKLWDAPNIWQGNSEMLWAGSVNPSDQEALPGMGGDQPDQLDEVKVKTGERKTWIYRPASTVYWQAIDYKGRPVVAVTAGKRTQQGFGPGDSTDLLLLESPLSARVVFSGSAGTVPSLGTRDGRRLWFGGQSGVFVLEETGPFRKVSDQAGWPAGPCV